MTYSTDNDNGSDDATADSNWHGPTITRRAAVSAVGSILGLSVADSVSAQQTSGGSSVAITSATRVAGTQMFIGPDSAKSNVSQEAGRVYRATDTQVEYYSDGTQWVKFGVGSTQEAVPQVRSEESPTNVLANQVGVSTPTAFRSSAAHGEGGNAFRGAALAPDGQVVLAPFNSSNVGLVDTSGSTVTYTSGPAHGEGGSAFIG